MATAVQVQEAFWLIDVNKDSMLTRAEVIKVCRKEENGHIRALLGLPQRIRQGDGSRADFEEVFQRLDADDSKKVSLEEFLDAFAAAGADTTRMDPMTRDELQAELAVRSGMYLQDDAAR